MPIVASIEIPGGNRPLLVSALICLISSGDVYADSASFAIRATVKAKCTISTQPTPISLAIDPSAVASAVTGNSSFGYKCTRDISPPVMTASAGNFFAGGNRLSDGSNFLPYTMNLPAAGAGLGFGAASEITRIIAASVALSDARAAAASGSYTDTVVITVNP